MTKLFSRVSKERMEILYEVEKRSISEIAGILQCGYGSVHRLLDHHSIRKRGRKEGATIYHSKNLGFNIEFFKKESPEFYYILGLWASDGCVYGERQLSLALTDKDVIDWVAKTVGYKNKISLYMPPKGNKMVYSIVLTSQEVVEIFEKYGIGKRKSLSLQFPANIPDKYQPHFVRGVFDGDGSVTLSRRKDNGAKTHALSIVSGSSDFIEGLCNVIKRYTGIDKTMTEHRNCYYFKTSHRREVILFGEWVYQGDAFGMSRKKEIINKITRGEAA